MKPNSLDKLQNWYLNHQRVIVAFSGGADSCLAAFLGKLYLGRENVCAVISKSASLKRKDLEFARKFASTYDIQLHEIETSEMEDSNYLSNSSERCFFCKTALYEYLQKMALTDYKGYIIINGNNYDDLSDYRPGMEAANQHNIYSPFIDCKITKDDIRSISNDFGLSSWNKPASPCLSSRFPYGEPITEEKLRQVETAEGIIENLGFRQVRVRHYGNKASLEVLKDEIPELKSHFEYIKERLLNTGFENIEIDEEGLVSGKLNRIL